MNKLISGADDVKKLLKLSEQVTNPLSITLVNQSLKPEVSECQVLPLLKEGSKAEENNYRQIFPLTVWSKSTGILQYF